MIGRIVYAIAYGVMIGIVVFIVGVVLASVGPVKPLTALGDELQRFAWVIGFLAAVLSFFGGGFPSIGNRPS